MNELNNNSLIIDGKPFDNDTWNGIAEKFIYINLKNKKQLDKYLRAVFGIYLASKPIDDGNSSPLDFVWDVYSTAKGINPNPCYNLTAIGARGSQKSLAGATIEALMLIQDENRDWFHCAAIMDQSERTYSYVQKFFSSPWTLSSLEGEPLMKKTSTKYGTYLQIGTGTIKSVSGFHGSVVIDEYDLMDRVVTKMAKGMLSAQKGHRPFMIILSSRYFATGNVDEIEKSEKDKSNGESRLHKWGILEMTERCPDSWSGPLTDKKGYVHDEDLIALSEEEYSKIDDKDSSEYIAYPVYQNCLTCGIFSFCKGKLKKQYTRQQNPFLEPLEETISKFKNNDLETFKTQRLNRKGSSKDLVYPTWNEQIHVKSISEMYEIYKGEPCPEQDPTWEFLINTFIMSSDCMFYFGADPGYTEAAAGLYVVDGMDRVYMVDEITAHGCSDSEFALLIWHKWGMLPLREGFPDQIPTFVKELKSGNNDLDPKKRKGALPASTRVDKSAGSVKDGISEFRKLLRVPGTVSDTRFCCLTQCVQFRSEISKYKRKVDKRTDEPLDEVVKLEDHHPDQCRYFIHTMFSKKKGNLRSARGEDVQTAKVELEKIDVKKTAFNINNPFRAPNANEIAAAIGVAGFRDNSNKKSDPKNDKKKTKLTFSL